VVHLREPKEESNNKDVCRREEEKNKVNVLDVRKVGPKWEGGEKGRNDRDW